MPGSGSGCLHACMRACMCALGRCHVGMSCIPFQYSTSTVFDNVPICVSSSPFFPFHPGSMILPREVSGDWCGSIFGRGSGFVCALTLGTHSDATGREYHPGLSLDFTLLGVWPGFFHVGRRSRMGIGKEEMPCRSPSLGRASVISILML
jgi:hypothetical protein